MTQHFIARVLKELGLAKQIPLVTVVTDPCYGFWKAWACDDVALYLVANDDAREQLIDYGVDPDRIKVSGMPVHPKFHEVDEKYAQLARQAYGLDPDKFTVFLNAGWIGGGNIPQIFRELARGELDVQAIFLAGKNEELRKEAEEIARTARFPVKVIGYSNEIEKLMQSANVMVSKLGGLTTFEALACRLPIIADGITPPMPQEAGTARLIERKGAGILLRHSSDIVATVRDLAADRDRYSRMRAATIGLAMPNSTEQIIREITALYPKRGRDGRLLTRAGIRPARVRYRDRSFRVKRSRVSLLIRSSQLQSESEIRTFRGSLKWFVYVRRPTAVTMYREP